MEQPKSERHSDVEPHAVRHSVSPTRALVAQRTYSYYCSVWHLLRGDLVEPIWEEVEDTCSLLMA